MYAPSSWVRSKNGPGFVRGDEREHLRHIFGAEVDERVVGLTDPFARDHLERGQTDQDLPTGRSLSRRPAGR